METLNFDLKFRDMTPYQQKRQAAAGDPKWEAVQLAFLHDRIVNRFDLFKWIPKTTVATAIGIKVDRFADMMDQPGKFHLNDLYLIADLANTSRKQLLSLFVEDLIPNSMQHG